MIGKQIGDIKIEKLLGKGGMGSVYLGHQTSLGRKVAIKVIAPLAGMEGDFAERFVREAQVAAQLSHPNIIQIFQIGEIEGQKYMIMEYVKGTNLQAMINEKRTLPLKLAVDIVLQAAKGLAEAHRRGVLHRDIKPENIFIDQNNHAKVADFGLAKVDTQSGLTKTGFMLGTPYYMSPEQVEGDNLDGRSDLYALGLTFFCCLVGKPPFSGNSTVQVLYKQVNEPLAFPEEVKKSLDPRVLRVIEKMTAKKREDRYADTDQAVQALRELWKMVELGDFVGGATHPEIQRPSFGENPPVGQDPEGQRTLAEQNLGALGDTAPGGLSGAYEDMPTFIAKVGPLSPQKPKTREEAILEEFHRLMEKKETSRSKPVSMPPKEEKAPEKKEEEFLVINWEYLLGELKKISEKFQRPEEFKLMTPQRDYRLHMQVPLSIVSREKRFFQALWIDSEGLRLFEDLVGSTPEVEGHLCALVTPGENPGPLLIFGISSPKTVTFPIWKLLKDQVTPDKARARNALINLLGFIRDLAASEGVFLYALELDLQ